jgi:hypothetical protein
VINSPNYLRRGKQPVAQRFWTFCRAESRARCYKRTSLLTMKVVSHRNRDIEWRIPVPRSPRGVEENSFGTFAVGLKPRPSISYEQ